MAWGVTLVIGDVCYCALCLFVSPGVGYDLCTAWTCFVFL